MRINASGNKPQHHQASSSSNKHFGIFVGKVKEVTDEQGLGRLRVWIPQISSANEEDPGSWFTMRYCPPFAGATSTEKESTAKDSKKFTETNQSYGMWFVPPTKNVNVICGFINGDTTQGIWWAMLPQDGHTHALPAVASGSTHDGEVFPVGERNRYNTADSQIENRPKHPTANRLAKQGLDKDLRRGQSNAGPFRAKDQHPGLAYGILTPGQHSFMLDDGEDGVSGQIRLRTFTGHQIVMHEEGGFIHIINAKGTAWIELDEDGNIDFYGAGDFSVHAEKNINLRAGNNINIDAANNINAVGRKHVRVEACETFNITGTNGVKMTSQQAMDVKAAAGMKFTGQRIDLNGPEAAPADLPEENTLATNQYVGRSVAARVPEHEPWGGHSKTSGGEEITLPVGVDDPELGESNITPAPESYQDTQPESEEEKVLAEACLPLEKIDALVLSEKGFELLYSRLGYRGMMYADGNGYSVGYGTRVDVYGPSSTTSKLDAGLKQALARGPSEPEARQILRQIVDRHVTPSVRTSLKQNIGSNKMCLTQAVFDSLVIAGYSDTDAANKMGAKVVESATSNTTGRPRPEDLAKIWANSGYAESANHRNADAQYVLSGNTTSSHMTTDPARSLEAGLAKDQLAVTKNRAENPEYPWDTKLGNGPETAGTVSPQDAAKLRLQRRGTSMLGPEESVDPRVSRMGTDTKFTKPTPDQINQYERSYYLNTGKPAPGTNLTAEQLRIKYGEPHIGDNAANPNAPTA